MWQLVGTCKTRASGKQTDLLNRNGKTTEKSLNAGVTALFVIRFNKLKSCQQRIVNIYDRALLRAESGGMCIAKKSSKAAILNLVINAREKIFKRFTKM